MSARPNRILFFMAPPPESTPKFPKHSPSIRHWQRRSFFALSAERSRRSTAQGRGLPMPGFRGLVLAASLALAAPAAAQAPSAVTPVCDRACMTGIVDRYLAALAAHDPAGLPLNRDVKFTENSARLKVGSEGLWIGASEAPTGPRIYAI